MGTAGLLIGLILAYLMSQVYNLIPIPLIAVILDILAVRGIFADQMLVESASSLRKSRRERRK